MANNPFNQNPQDEKDFRKFLKDFIKKMERDLAREEFIQNNPQFEKVENEHIRLIFCKN